MEMELQTFNATEHEKGDEMIANRQTNGELKNSLKTSQKWLYTVAVFGFYFAKGAGLAATLFFVNGSFTYSYQTNDFSFKRANFFLSRVIAYIVGCVLSPFGFACFPCEPQLAVVTAVLAIATMIMPAFSMQFYVMTMLAIISQLAEGYMDSGIQPYVAHIWRGNKQAAPVMQANALIFSISYSLSTAIYNSLFYDEQLESICSTLPKADNFTVYHSHFATTSTTASMNIGNSALSMESDGVTHTSVDCSIQVTNASKSFFGAGSLYLLIPGLIWGVGSILAIVSKLPQASCNMLSSCQPASRSNSEYQQNKSRRLLCTLFIGMLTVLVVLHVFIFNELFVISLRLLPSSHQRSHFPNKIACLSSTVVIVTSVVVSSSKIIACCLPLGILGAVIMTFSVSTYSDLLMYIGSQIVSFGLTPVLPACYAWTNEVTGLSPTHSAIISVGAMLGSLVDFSVFRTLRAAFKYKPILFAIIACCVFQFAILIVLILVEWQLKKRRRA